MIKNTPTGSVRSHEERCDRIDTLSKFLGVVALGFVVGFGTIMETLEPLIPSLALVGTVILWSTAFLTFGVAGFIVLRVALSKEES